MLKPVISFINLLTKNLDLLKFFRKTYNCDSDKLEDLSYFFCLFNLFNFAGFFGKLILTDLRDLTIFPRNKEKLKFFEDIV